jgi:hypothetical protein
MPMPPYPIVCYAPGCKAKAVYKVAARWCDGVTTELKTYYLACPDCLPNVFRKAVQKRNECKLAQGESLDNPAIYEMVHGLRDRELKRREDLESSAAGELGTTS